MTYFPDFSVTHFSSIRLSLLSASIAACVEVTHVQFNMEISVVTRLISVVTGLISIITGLIFIVAGLISVVTGLISVLTGLISIVTGLPCIPHSDQ